ncbi:hypothetical protein OKW23_000874 [Bacilli bacterium PM5-9]|nr:hypothetical protein [Bacilli bacterium PM5-9]
MKKRNKIIIVVIMLLICICGIGYKVHFDNIEKERIALLNSARDEKLSNDELKYITDNKYIKKEDIQKLSILSEKLDDDKLDKTSIENIKNEQGEIYSKINDKIKKDVVTIDKELTESINKLKTTKDEDKEKDKVKKVIDKKIENGSSKDILDSNVKILKEKKSQSKQLDKIYSLIVARVEKENNKFNKDEILKGDFSSLAGYWENGNGSSITIATDGSVMFNGVDGGKPFVGNVTYNNKNNTYGWSVKQDMGGAAAMLWPPGVEIRGSFNMHIDSDTTKLRLAIGHMLGDSSSIYTRPVTSMQTTLGYISQD